MGDSANNETVAEQDGDVVFDDELLSDGLEPDEPAPLRGLSEARALRPARTPQVSRVGSFQVGAIIDGKYRVERVLRASASSTTLEACHLQLGQRVAIKLLSIDPQARPESVGRFLRGARCAVQLHNEHVARVLDLGTLTSGVPYAVSEYFSGSDLRRVLRVREALPVIEATDYALQVCEALAEGHAFRVVHRNLKPSNVVLARRAGASFVKVLDFGSEDPLSDVAFNHDSASAAVTSLAYLAPEQIRDPSSVDLRADVWAVGALLHEMLTGAAPYTAESVPALLAAIAADSPAPLRSLQPDVPEELEAAVLRCLSKERSERFASVAELGNALGAFASEAGRGSLDRIDRSLGSRTRATRPPPLPSRAIVHVPPALQTAAPSTRPTSGPFGRLILTAVGFGCAAALGAFAAVHSMQGALSAAAARTPLVAESPILTAPTPTQTPFPVATPSVLSVPGLAPKRARADPGPLGVTKRAVGFSRAATLGSGNDADRVSALVADSAVGESERAKDLFSETN